MSEQLTPILPELRALKLDLQQEEADLRGRVERTKADVVVKLQIFDQVEGLAQLREYFDYDKVCAVVKYKYFT